MRDLTPSPFAELWETAENGAAMCALISGTRGWLMYLRHDGDSGFHSQDPTYAGDADALLDFQLNNGQIDQYPLSWTLPVEQIHRALQYFRETHLRPDFVTWQKD